MPAGWVTAANGRDRSARTHEKSDTALRLQYSRSNRTLEYGWGRTASGAISDSRNPADIVDPAGRVPRWKPREEMQRQDRHDQRDDERGGVGQPESVRRPPPRSDADRKGGRDPDQRTLERH